MGARTQRDSAVSPTPCYNRFHQFISDDLIVDDHCQGFNYWPCFYALTVQFKANQQQRSEETTVADARMDLITFQGTLGTFQKLCSVSTQSMRVQHGNPGSRK